MKKSILIVMSVAILGGLGLYINKGNGPKTAIADSPAVSTTAPNNTTLEPSASSSVSSTTPSSTSSTSSTTSSPDSGYKDGTYNGRNADTLYGTVQVAAVISGGRITDIQFLQMPNDQENSKAVTAMAEPQLKSETLKAQSAKIDFVSGATQSSAGFKESLQAALDKATV